MTRPLADTLTALLAQAVDDEDAHPMLPGELRRVAVRLAELLDDADADAVESDEDVYPADIAFALAELRHAIGRLDDVERFVDRLHADTALDLLGIVGGLRAELTSAHRRLGGGAP